MGLAPWHAEVASICSSEDKLGSSHLTTLDFGRLENPRWLSNDKKMTQLFNQTHSYYGKLLCDQNFEVCFTTLSFGGNRSVHLQGKLHQPTHSSGGQVEQEFVWPPAPCRHQREFRQLHRRWRTEVISISTDSHISSNNLPTQAKGLLITIHKFNHAKWSCKAQLPLTEATILTGLFPHP